MAEESIHGRLAAILSASRPQCQFRVSKLANQKRLTRPCAWWRHRKAVTLNAWLNFGRGTRYARSGDRFETRAHQVEVMGRQLVLVQRAAANRLRFRHGMLDAEMDAVETRPELGKPDRPPQARD